MNPIIQGGQLHTRKWEQTEVCACDASQTNSYGFSYYWWYYYVPTSNRHAPENI